MGSVLRRMAAGFFIISRSSEESKWELPRWRVGIGEGRNSSIRSVSGTGSMAVGMRVGVGVGVGVGNVVGIGRWDERRVSKNIEQPSSAGQGTGRRTRQNQG